jgi:cytidylate kinase
MSSEPLIRISITGELGSGKSTVAKALVTALNVEFFSTGGFQREMAAKLGITTLELNHRADVDPTIDDEIDGRTKSLGRSGKSFIIDSRLAWRFLPGSFKVFLVCPPNIAAGRIMGQQRVSETYTSPEDATRQLMERQNSERLRFLKTYDAKQGHYRNYDCVIDTSQAVPEQVTQAVIDGFRRNGTGHQMLAAPRGLFPLPASAEDMAHPRPKVICAHRVWALVRGHHLVSEAIRRGDNLIPVKLMAQDDETFAAGKTARSVIEELLRPDAIAAWESGHAFKFQNYPAFLGTL